MAQSYGALTAGSGEDWVPAGDRWLGFGTKSIAPGLVLLALWAIWAHLVPAVNSQAGFDAVRRFQSPGK
jgi:hypothetical protein